MLYFRLTLIPGVFTPCLLMSAVVFYFKSMYVFIFLSLSLQTNDTSLHLPIWETLQ